jgi:hypothetical protein
MPKIVSESQENIPVADAIELFFFVYQFLLFSLRVLLQVEKNH